MKIFNQVAIVRCVAVILFVLVRCSASAQTSSLVYEGGNGKLAYGTYANQGDVSSVNTVPDFSTAGYMGGGEPIPFVPAAIVVTNEVGDDTTLIQNAIDTVAGMPVGANGFRGAVLIKAGNYEVSSTLNINASGIVIRGEGNQASGGTKITFTAVVQDNLFQIAGTGAPSEVGGTRQTITNSYVPVGAVSFGVTNGSAFTAGDKIQTIHKMNATWLAATGMDSIELPDTTDTDGDGYTNESWSVADYQLTYERTVTAVTGNTIYVDAPFVQAVENQYGGADVYEYTFGGQITNVGIESLRLESAFLGDNDEQHGWIAVKFNDTRNGWARQITARYFGYSCVSVNGTCHYITVEDCAQLDPKSQTIGGRKYSFNLDDGTYVLMQRCYTRGGRHDFVSGSKTPGPNVFVDGLNESAFADTGPHHRYSTGQIYDNIKNNYHINVQNRRNSGSGHGWAGAQILFWNCDAGSLVCDAPAGAMNWSIGCVGSKGSVYYSPDEPDGIWESQNTHITMPRSLYYRQLQDRLGRDAVRNVIIPEQEDGTIWNYLSSWAGEGLFGSNVIAWVDKGSILVPTNSVSVEGIVRNLQMLDNGVTSLWTKVSGPGDVTFGVSSNLATTASFAEGGAYVLGVYVDDGTTAASAEVAVFYDDGSVDTSVSGATKAAGGSATLNADLNRGGPADVYFLWDSSDKGTNLNAWAYTNILYGQGNGALSINATGLTVEATYYYRCFASNSVSTAWSESTNFFVINGMLASSKDYILGEREDLAPPLGYYSNSISPIVGTGGSGGARSDRNVVIGYMLPTLSAGKTVDGAAFSFEIIGARDSTGEGNLPDLNVYILDTADPDSTGTDFFYHGANDTAGDVAFVGAASVSISGTGQNDFPADAEDRTIGLTGDALDMIKSFYGGDNIPERNEIFFRFSMSEDPAVTTYRRYNIDLADDESILVITSSAAMYSVTYDGNSSTGGAVPADPELYTNGATVTVLGNTNYLVKSGYAFDGWNTETNGSGIGYVEDDTFSMLASNVTLYAQWAAAATYSLTVSNGTGDGSYVDGAAVPVAADAPADGYRFSSWTTSDGGSFGDSNLSSTVYTMPANAATVTAQYVLNTAPDVNAGPDQTVGFNAQSSWTPSEITTVAWYDAADTNTVHTSGGGVTNWQDKSGKGYDLTQGMPGACPASGTEEINNLNVLDFDGIDDVLTSAAFTAPDADFVVSFVLQPLEPVTETSYKIICQIPYAVSEVLEIQNKGSTDTLKWYAPPDDGFLGGTSVSGQPTIYTLSSLGSTTEVYTNGTLIESSPITAISNILGIALGARMDSSAPSRVRIGELVVHTNDLSDRQKIEGYLAHKWGLTNSLPVGHPYKAAEPKVPAAEADLDGAVTDPEGDPFTVVWSLENGPALVTFTNITTVDTTVKFTEQGIYTFRLTGEDGLATNYDECIVTFTNGVTAIGSVPYAWLGTWTNDYEASVTNDWDGDSFTTVQEYWSGTDPMDSDSFLGIDTVYYDGSNVVIEWRHAYVDTNIPPICIQSRPSLSTGNWDYADQKDPENGTNVWQTAIPPNSFFQLCVTNMP